MSHIRHPMPINASHWKQHRYALGHRIDRWHARSTTPDKAANTTYTKIAPINELVRSSDIGARNLRNAALAASREDAQKFIDVITKKEKNATG